MADSKVTIKIDADASAAKRGFAEVEAAASSAMDAGARSAQKLSQSLDGVAESAKLSARQIKVVAAGMASMAAGVAASAMRANGMETEARYAQSASSSAVQGASMMAPLGPLAMIAGAAGGAGLGLLKQYFEDEAVGKQQKGAENQTADALSKAREEMERVTARTDTFAKMLERLGNTEADAASREQWRADEIVERQREIDEATERMKAAEAGLRRNAAGISGPMTEEQTKAAQELRDAWAAANKDLATARAEMKALEGVKIDKPGARISDVGAERTAGEFTSLEKLGIGFNGAANTLAQEGNRIATEQLDVLKQIASVAGNGVVFG